MDEIKVSIFRRDGAKVWQMQYRDPITRNKVRKSTGTNSKRDALKAAGQWQAEVQEGRHWNNTKILWDEFRERYENEKLASLADGTAENAATAFNHVERVINPKRLASMTTDTVSLFQSKLRGEGMKDTSIASYLGHLRAALRWAAKQKLLREAPHIEMPKRAKGVRMRGRPITGEEFDRIIEATPKVRKLRPATWARFLSGLWVSGLRLGEGLILSWDDDQPFQIDLTGKHPRFRIWAEGEKAHRDRLLPMTPNAAEFFLQTPQSDRYGLVFPLGMNGRQLSDKRVSRTITDIGRAANVVVNKAENKYASAQDLRRSFGARWSRRVKPITLMQLMRHENVETTMKYYAAQDAEEIADELHREFGMGASLGASGKNAIPHQERTDSTETKKTLENQGF